MMDMMDDLPGGAMATRPVHFFWVVDTSSSMSVDGRMDRLNFAIKEAIPEMRSVALDNPTAQLLVRVLGFANGSRWIEPDPVPVADFTWTPQIPDGLTDFGDALSVLSAQLEAPPMPDRALPPVIAVVSDGMPTDEWREGLRQLDASLWGDKAVRIAISIDDHSQTDVLEEFTRNPELVFAVDSGEALARTIRWVSTVAVKVASQTGGISDPQATLVGQVGFLDDDDDDDDEMFL